MKMVLNGTKLTCLNNKILTDFLKCKLLITAVTHFLFHDVYIMDNSWKEYVVAVGVPRMNDNKLLIFVMIFVKLYILFDLSNHI